MRSCASEIRTSHGIRPGYFSGARARSISAPPVSWAISPTLDDRPPAPLSVRPLYRPSARASARKSATIFCVIGSPIWTACTGDDSSSSTLEKVAPWIPSLPIRPPTMTTTSPGRTTFSAVGRPAEVTGITATVPQ